MKYFYRFDDEELILEVPDRVYYPREDSELMAKILREEHVKGKKFLDIGCGSGILAIIAAKMGAKVVAADINPIALTAAKANAQELGLDIEFIESNIFDNINDSFDVIIFNPPYLPENEDDLFVEDKITYAGGPTGRKVIEKFVRDAKGHLNPHGKILMLISTLTSEERTADIFEEHGFKTKIIARKKIPWEELIVIEARM
jgi:release factor glutamine methyltransferase